MADKFWLVWRNGSQSAAKQHPTLEKAQIEASRLAKTNPGAEFYVLESLNLYKGDVHVEAYSCNEPLSISKDGARE